MRTQFAEHVCAHNIVSGCTYTCSSGCAPSQVHAPSRPGLQCNRHPTNEELFMAICSLRAAQSTAAFGLVT